MLLRMRKYINDVLIEQIPNLADMVRMLEHLRMMNTQAQVKHNPFVMEQIPEFRT